MPFKFVANLSRLFTDLPLPARFQAAKDAGFDHAEITSPLCEIGHSSKELAEARDKAGINVVLINGCTGSFSRKEFGLAARPDKNAQMEDDFKLTLEYAKDLQAERVHIMSGRRTDDLKLAQMESVYKMNLLKLATELQGLGIVCQIEFICNQTIPDYFLSSGAQAVRILNELNHPNLQLQLDIYHLQMTEGNLTESIKHYMKYTSYIQVSQVPGRNEPNFPGEINYDYIFKLFDTLGYTGYIGLEYSPSSDTLSSFGWMKQLK